jgi:hypothetical protein
MDSKEYKRGKKEGLPKDILCPENNPVTRGNEMSKLSGLFAKNLKVANLGLESFHDSLKKQGVDVLQVDWRPPSPGVKILSKLDNRAIDKANEKAARRMIASQPILVDIKQARDVIPGMSKNTILHAGPPIEWRRMCGPVKGAIMGALVYEGLAKDATTAKKLAASGKIKFSPCHHHTTVGPMAGVVSSSMYVFVVKNTTFGNYAYCTLNEGLGKVLRFGAYSQKVIERLKWMEEVLAPGLKKALKISAGVNIKNLTAQALQMGDECHNRNVAATSLFLKEITPYLLKTDLNKDTICQITEFISGNAHFFLNLSMAACKATADTILDYKGSSLVSVMARNGTEIGIRVAGLGKRWFSTKAGMPKGLYFAGYSDKEANPDLGDSTISEIAGIGGFAMASAPAIVQFIGGSPQDAIRYTKEMYEITVAKHSIYKMPNLDFIGTPIGIDIRKVIETGITPFINTGIAHKKPGVGQIGAGILRAPMSIFEEALKALSKI